MIFGMFLAVGLCAGWVAVASTEFASSGQTPPAGSLEKPKRVVLRVNRNLEVHGYLELEDDEVIVVRDLQDRRHNFAKARVGQIVRLTEPAEGQTGVVRLIDGQIRQGIIIADEFDHVIVEIEGIRANIKRSVVDEVVLSPTTDELYAEYKRTLDPNNYDAHLVLCQWLTDKRRYQQAKDEVLMLLEKVEMPEARQLLNRLNAQLALAEPPPRPEIGGSDGEAGAGGSGEGTDRARSGPVRPADLLPDQLITPADVNLIRVYELDFDHPPRVTIPPSTIREFIEKYGTNPLIPAHQTGRNAMFRAASDRPLEIVRLMFEIRARDMYGQIRVNSEPQSLNLFRRRVHDTWLINNCATTACHGGTHSGRFFLHRRDYKDEHVRYTNLLILERLQLDPDWPLINFERPEDSLIIQYALPRNLARKPHPPVDGWKPAFGTVNPRMREDAIEWIKSMMQPRPIYPVEYEPPALSPIRIDSGTFGGGPENRVPR